MYFALIILFSLFFYQILFNLGKIAFLVPQFVSNFDFGPPLKLLTNFVLLFYLITQSWSSNPELDVDGYKGMLTVTCHVLIGWWLSCVMFSLDVESMEDEMHCYCHWPTRTWYVTVNKNVTCGGQHSFVTLNVQFWIGGPRLRD